VAEECWEGVQVSLPSKAELEVCLPMLGPESCLCQAITLALFFQLFQMLQLPIFNMLQYDSSLTLGPKGQLKETHIASGRRREGAQASLQPS